MNLKKSMFCALALVLAVAKPFAQSGGQVYVNRLFSVSTGNPVFNPILNPFGIQWSASIESSSGGILTVGHTSNGGQEDILLTKHDVDGGLVFSISKNVSGNQNDYGVALCEEPNTGDIYISGVTDNNGTTDFDIVVFRYSSTGALLDSALYAGPDGMNDIAVAIKIHPTTNEVIVAATSEITGNSYDYLVIKYDLILNYIASKSHDYVNLIDVPAGIEFSGTGDICLIGASASSVTRWEYSVVTFDASSLSFISDARTNLPGFGYDQPLAFCKDAAQNIYITGRSSTNGTNYNIRTIKILSNLTTIAWNVVYDGVAGLEDVGNTIALDQNGDVIVGGFSTKSNNLKEMICRKLNGTNGALMWHYNQSSVNNAGDAFIKKIAVNPINNNIYYTGGELGLSGVKHALAGRLTHNGVKRWQREIEDAANDVSPSDIELTGDGLYVISVSDSVLDSYMLTKFKDFELDTAKIYNGNGSPACKARELIIGFMPSAINTAAIDGTGSGSGAPLEFGTTSDFLTPEADSLFHSAIGEFGLPYDVKVMKIFDALKTTDTVAVSRLGQYNPIPDFWSTLLVEFPSSLPITQANAFLKSIPNVVSFAHPNIYLIACSAPNDSLYPTQKSIDSTAAGINVEEAWDYVPSGGKSYVKGGVFDTGVNWKHPDFGYDGTTPATSKLDGWHFFGDNVGQPLKSTPVADSSGHGTKVMGIIGADRNNNKGIAGIAGGDRAAGNPGVQLYSLNVVETQWIHNVLRAMLETSRGGFYTQYGFPINFANHSWYANLPLWSDSQVVALREQVHFAWRQNVTFVAARGIVGTNGVDLPATFDSTWVLSVGGTDSLGNYKSNLVEENYWAASYGRGIDIAAPCVNSIVRTTNHSANYSSLNGTSASAAHASGVVGLLMSYMNDTTGVSSYKNLAPEDCEFIIQRSARGFPIYDSLVGYGLLNAGGALKYVDKSDRILYHYGTNALSPYTIVKSPFSYDDTIRLTERYENYELLPKLFQPGKYVVDTYWILCQVTHNQTFGTDSVIAAWPRHSSSFVYDLPKGPKKLLDMHERVKLNWCTNSSASLHGYIYKVRDTLGNQLGWWPCDTSFSNLLIPSNRPKTIMEYSMLTKNTAVGIAKNVKESLNVSVFPNPANKSQTLLIQNDKESDLTVELYDLMGRRLKTVYKGKSTVGQTVITHDVERLPNSMYIYVIELDGKRSGKKFLKQ